MKLCQKCIDAILKDVFGIGLRLSVSDPSPSPLDIEDPYIGIKQTRPSDSENGCEFWAHKAFRESERNLSEANYGALEAGEKNY